MDRPRNHQFRRVDKRSKLVGWRYAAFVSGLFGITFTAVYFVAIEPMMNPGKWQAIQRETRAGYNQEEIQPGNMRVWSDPFGRKKKSDN